MVEEGSPAPDFTLVSDAGDETSLESLRGRPVVLYFYPKDDTPGLHDAGVRHPRQLGRVRAGRRDGAGRQPRLGRVPRRFRANYKLPFPLLVDSDHAVAEAYGVWGEKKNYGKTYMGIIRSGFVIDAEGNLAAVKHNVKADRHSRVGAGRARPARPTARLTG